VISLAGAIAVGAIGRSGGVNPGSKKSMSTSHQRRGVALNRTCVKARTAMPNFSTPAMQIARHLLFASVALLAVSAKAQKAIEPHTANERVFVESVQKRLSACFTMVGVDRTIPVAAKLPPDKELLAAVQLRASGPLVHDGYNYMLFIHSPSNSAFVLQLGGFAGSQTVFGPIPLTTTCR